MLNELGVGVDGKEISEEDMLKELLLRVKSELRVDYLVTGSKVTLVNSKSCACINKIYRWSLKASQEAVRLLGPEYVNIAADARKINDGKFGVIPDESTWKLSSRPTMVYLCENEVSYSLSSGYLLILPPLKTVDGVEWKGFPKSLEPTGSDDDPIVVGDFSSTILSRRIPIEV